MVKVAVVGAGAIARRGHLPALAHLACIDVTLVEVDADLLRRVQEEFAIPEASTDYDTVLRDPEVRAICICTPTPTHHSLITPAIRSGKHVLVEKPLTLDLESAVDIYKLAQEHKIIVSVVQNYRYFSAVHRARQRLQDGYIGHPVSMHGVALTRFPNSWTRGRWLYNPRAALTDFAPHLIDMVHWMNDGSLEHVVAYGGDFSRGNIDFVTNAQALLSFADGTTANLDISWLTGTLMFGLDIHGTGGHLFLDVRGNHVFEVHGTVTPFNDVRLFSQRMVAAARGLWTGEFFAGALSFYGPLWRDFLRAVDRGATPRVSIEDGVWVNLVIEAIFTSLRTGTRVNVRALLAEMGLDEQQRERVLQPPWRFYASTVLEAIR